MEGLTACAACYRKSSRLGKMASAIQKREETIQNKEETMHEWELREKQKRFRLEDSIMRRLEKEGVYVSERGGLIVTDARMTAETRARDELIEEKTNEVNRIKLVSERIASKTNTGTFHLQKLGRRIKPTHSLQLCA